MKRRAPAPKVPAPAPAPPPTTPTSNPSQRKPSRKRLAIYAVAALLLIGLGWFAYSKLTDPLRDVKQALDRRDFASAEELLKNQLTAHPDDTETLLLATQAARREGDYGRAAELLRTCERNGGPKSEIELERRLLRAHSGDLKEADALFSEFAEGKPSARQAQVLEAYIEGKLNVLAPQSDVQMDAAAAEARGLSNLRRAVELWLQTRTGAEDQVQGLVWQGRVHLFANEHSAAVLSLRNALERNPAHFEARYHLMMAIAQELPHEAVQHLEILDKRKPGNFRLRFGLASTYHMLGRLKESRAILEELHALDRNNVTLLVELGQLALDERKGEEAEQHLVRALQLAPNSPLVHLAMSRCQQFLGHPDEAAKHRKRFDELSAQRK